MSNVRVSYSKLNTFKECEKKFEFRYIQKLQSERNSSALYFGNAIDNTLNYILSCKKNKDVFDWTVLWDKYDTLMKKNNTIDYFNSDISFPVLINTVVEGIDLVESASLTQVKQKELVKEIKANKPELFTELAYKSLYLKGKLILTTFANEIVHLFDVISSVQEELLIDNGEGDALKCIIDFTAKTTLEKLLANKNTYIPDDLKATLKLDKKYEIVIDNKTSSKPYSKNIIKTSEQLSMYNEYYDTDLCMYIVFNKDINKKGLSYQIIIDTVDTNFQKEVFDKISETMYSMKVAISDNTFEKNESACFSYGRKCEYYQLCKYGSKKGLVTNER